MNAKVSEKHLSVVSVVQWNQTKLQHLQMVLIFVGQKNIIQKTGWDIVQICATVNCFCTIFCTVCYDIHKTKIIKMIWPLLFLLFWNYSVINAQNEIILLTTCSTFDLNAMQCFNYCLHLCLFTLFDVCCEKRFIEVPFCPIFFPPGHAMALSCNFTVLYCPQGAHAQI